jgi:tetratricopeptide (TPR) repeat protein
VTAARQALSLARNSKKLQWEQAALQFLVHLHEALGSGQEAISARKQALEVARKLGPQSEISGLIDLGVQYERLEQYAEAIGVYQQSLEGQATLKARRYR